MVCGSTFAKTICSICYEDLKPIAEDLQSIFYCGHVFHELCLQQWFEYCSSSKKYSCPVCKQSCTAKDVSRLYFQSVGDANDSVLSQKPIECEKDDPEALRGEVRRLETKVLGLSSALERQGKDIKELNEELCLCKDQAKKELALKDEALRQKALVQYMHQLKSEELDKSTLECIRLRERSMALAKELAALKLVSDLDLDDEEILKLASLGNGANNKDTIDILKKSLVMRNRSYKELMAKCNTLGRGEAHSSKNLEKAKEKIQKLKVRIQELETAVEAKENDILRALKANRKNSGREKIIQNSVGGNNINISTEDTRPDHREKKHSASLHDSDPAGSLTVHPLSFTKWDTLSSSNNLDIDCAEGVIILDLEKVGDVYLSTDKDALKSSEAVNGIPKLDLEQQRNDGAAVQKSTSLWLETCNKDTNSVSYGTRNLVREMALTNENNCDRGKSLATSDDKDMALLGDETKEVEPTLNIKREYPSSLTSSTQGDFCFSGGLLGPDGTNRHLGKWCKRGQLKGSFATQASSAGHLIAVGADGRGGRVKVLRSLNESSLEDKEPLSGTKRCKYGAKTTNMSQGCLQIEHFFGRVGR